MSETEQLALARKMLLKGLPPEITGRILYNRWQAYNAKRSKKKQVPIESYLNDVLWPRYKPARKQVTNRTSADELADMASEARTLEIQQEKIKADFEAINEQRTRNGHLPLSWNTFCRDRRLGIHASDGEST